LQFARIFDITACSRKTNTLLIIYPSLTIIICTASRGKLYCNSKLVSTVGKNMNRLNIVHLVLIYILNVEVCRAANGGLLLARAQMTKVPRLGLALSEDNIV
jgi:hypothetical protein